MKWKIYCTALMSLVIGAWLKNYILEYECKHDGQIQFNASKIYECKEIK